MVLFHIVWVNSKKVFRGVFAPVRFLTGRLNLPMPLNPPLNTFYNSLGPG
jgi:hypothetical protein